MPGPWQWPSFLISLSAAALLTCCAGWFFVVGRPVRGGMLTSSLALPTRCWLHPPFIHNKQKCLQTLLNVPLPLLRTSDLFILSPHLCYVSITAGTSHHKRSGLEQHKLIVLQFCRSEVHQIPRATAGVLVGPGSLQEVWGGSPLLAFSSCWLHPHSSVHGPPSSQSAMRSESSQLAPDPDLHPEPRLPLTHSAFLLPSSTFKYPVITLGPPR